MAGPGVDWTEFQDYRCPFASVPRDLSHDLGLHRRICRNGHRQPGILLANFPPQRVPLDRLADDLRFIQVDGQDSVCATCGAALDQGTLVEAWVGVWLPETRQDVLIHLPPVGDPVLALWDFKAPPRVVGADHPALGEFERAIAARQAFGMVEWEMGEFDADEAIRRLQALLEEWPDYPYIWKLMAHAHKSEGELQETVRCLERVTRRWPDDANAHFMLADVLDETDADAEAIKAYDRSLSLDPKNPTAWAQRGIVLRRQKRVDEALESYRRALEIDPHHSVALTSTAVARFLQGQMEVAASCLALLKPSDVKGGQLARNAHAMASRYGAQLADEERWLEAARQFEIACGLEPEHVDSWYNQALCLFHADAYPDAWARLRHVLALDATHRLAQGNLRRFEEAVEMLTEVRGYGALLARKTFHTVPYRKSRGGEVTMFNFLVDLETQTQFVLIEGGCLSLDSDQHFLRLLVAKGHNARVQCELEGRPIVFAVPREPDRQFLEFAGARNWKTPGGDLVQSAPVPIFYAPTGVPERSLVRASDEVFQLPREHPLETGRSGPDFFYPEEYIRPVAL